MRVDYNVLTWYDRLADQERFKWYAYGQISCVTALSNLLPPFQVIKPKTGAPIDSFILHNIDTGASTDILSEMEATGLEVLEPAGRTYDIVMYPSTIQMDLDLPGDRYYAEMSSAGRTWYSEIFGFRPDMTGYIRLEWCHNGNFEYTGGHIQYTTSGYGNGFKNYIWIQGTLAKPTYPNNKEFDQRGGRKFVTFHSSSKEYRLVFVASEAVLDALSKVDQHDVVKMYVDGQEYEVDEFEFNQEWSTNGNLATVTASIYTYTVVVETVATGAPSSETCEIAAGTCIPQVGNAFVAKSVVSLGDTNYLNFTYQDADGVTQNLVANEDYVVVREGSIYRLRQFNGSGYTVTAFTGYANVYIENTNEYWYDRDEGIGVRISKTKSMVDLTSPPTFYGQTGQDDAIYELWLEDAGGARTFVRRTDNATFDLGEQIDPGDNTYLVLVTTTVKCGPIMEHKFMIPVSYILFTDQDGETDVYLSNADGDTSILLGGSDIDSIPDPTI